MKRLSWFAGLLSVGVLLAAVHPSAAQEERPGDGPDIGSNVQITITIGDVEEDAGRRERTYKLIAREGGAPARMLMGWRMPVQ